MMTVLHVALDWTGYIVAVVVILELATRVLPRGSGSDESSVEERLLKNTIKRWLPRTMAGVAAIAVFTVTRLFEGAQMEPIWSKPWKEPIFYAIAAALSLVLERPSTAAHVGASQAESQPKVPEQLDNRLTALHDHLDICKMLCIEMRKKQKTLGTDEICDDATFNLLREELTVLEQLIQCTSAALLRQKAKAITEVEA